MDAEIVDDVPKSLSASGLGPSLVPLCRSRPSFVRVINVGIHVDLGIHDRPDHLGRILKMTPLGVTLCDLVQSFRAGDDGGRQRPAAHDHDSVPGEPVRSQDLAAW